MMDQILKIVGGVLGLFLLGFIGYVSYSAFTGYQGDAGYIEEISNPNSKTNLQNTSTQDQNATTTATSTKPKQSNNNKMNTRAKITTNMGEIEIELLDSKSPNTVANFTRLADSGFYNGVRFHRVIEGFMIQTGDPLSKDITKKDSWGTGGPGYKFADELTGDEQYTIGTVAMANSGPNTNGSQFFIMTSNTPLPPSYTVFGKVVSGQATADKIEKTPVDGRDRPMTDVIISKIEIAK
jgi:cyclophilin family peptidyl-prolyl cis-trans isomerase